MKILDGKETANKIYSNLKNRIEYLNIVQNIIPCLAVIIVGDNPESHSYVRMKAKKCKDLLISSNIIHLDISVSDKSIINEIKKLNNNSGVHGILVQLPLPKHLNTNKILQNIISN